MKAALWKIRRSLNRIVCLFRGHYYPHYVFNSWSLYTCARGCGHVLSMGYLTDAQFEKAMDELPPRPDDDEGYCWLEEYE